jgi:hypothetical protein
MNANEITHRIVAIHFDAAMQIYLTDRTDHNRVSNTSRNAVHFMVLSQNSNHKPP